MTAVIRLPDPILERLRRFGQSGMTDAQMIGWLLDQAEREQFVGSMRHQFASTPRDAYVDLEDL
jgi:hypothetical protein